MARITVDLTASEFQELAALTMSRQAKRDLGQRMPHVEDVAGELIRIGLREARNAHYAREAAAAFTAGDDDHANRWADHQ